MGQGALKAFLRFGILIILLAIGILFIEKPGTPPFYATLFSLLIGVLLVGLVFLVARLTS